MRTKTLLAAAAAAIALTAALAGCSATPATTAAPSSEPSSVSSDVEYTGTFAGLNDKNVSGSITIIGDTVTLEGFSSDEGPDLHLYLTNGTSESDVASGTEVSIIAFDQASQSFTLPAGVDASEFTNIVVHCDKALAIFGAASLSM